MASRRIVVLVALLVLSGAAPALAADTVKPRAGVLLSGMIQFPRAQRMSIQTGATDGTRLTVAMGFDGRCKGGGLGELWAANVRTSRAIRARDGRISATLTGTQKNLDRVKGRTGVFTWRLVGRFVKRDVVTAVVTGTAQVRIDGKVVSKCTIAKPAKVRLAIRSS